MPLPIQNHMMKKTLITLCALCGIQIAMAQPLVREGLTWTTHTWNIFTNEDLGHHTTWFEYAFSEEGRDVFEVYETEGTEPLKTEQTLNYGQIHQQGDQVYFKKYLKFSDGAPEEWRLMYDFGLQPGESVIVYPVEPGYNDPTRSPERITCLNWSAALYPDWETMEILDFNLDLEEDAEDIGYEGSQGQWIKGIGSTSYNGVLDNIQFGWIDGYCHRTVVRENGKVLMTFGPDPSGIASTANTTFDVKLQGRNLSIRTDRELPVTVTGTDGRQIAHSDGNAAEAEVVLPQAGVYLVRSGARTHKVIVR